ncbi:unnamed protein product [Paramecium sonneborni]|uniref:Transmembrane protein n=1 Tax=Paramecium sonneborni TaxID=65129 RepID=A0A8S1N7F6_9CILI|nr:unnamed protein product [Paramecium sonneborni]
MYRSCQTAPKYIRTNIACQQYFQNCTFDVEGSLRFKTQCNDVTIKESCIIQYNIFIYKMQDHYDFGMNSYMYIIYIKFYKIFLYFKGCENSNYYLFLQFQIILFLFIGGCMSISDDSNYDFEESCQIDTNIINVFGLVNLCIIYISKCSF